MRRGFAVAVLLGLAACAAQSPVLTLTEGFRDPSAQIASQTNVTAARMEGDWNIRQRFDSAIGPQGSMALTAQPDGTLRWTFESEDCPNNMCETPDGLVVLTPAGPGRWRPVDPDGAGFDAELWVMWMDFDDRTVAIGTPDGRFGFIMDKSASGGSDRIAAARDIMDWFGYDIARLESVTH